MNILITLLVFVLIAAIVLWLTRTAVSAIAASAGWPPAAPNIIVGIVALILLFAFLAKVGWLGPHYVWP